MQCTANFLLFARVKATIVMQTEPKVQDQSPPPALSRAQSSWLVAVQLAALGVAGWAFYLSPAPSQASQALLGLLAIALGILAFHRGWRRGEVAGIVAGILLAVACRQAQVHTLTLDGSGDLAFLAMYVPVLAPVMLAVTLVFAVWGLFVRIGLRRQAPFAGAALLAGALLGALGLLFAFVLNYLLHFTNLIENYQLVELLALVALYPPALWLGGIALRPQTRLALLPLLLSLLTLGYLALWHIPGAASALRLGGGL